MEPPAATTTAGIYCKTCGYDLRASGEAGRCPECGRGFSPDDPRSFRTRPFAAPWQWALGRWAKRCAVLPLGLIILLAGFWGWYYWGWKQERAALAELGVRGSVMDVDILAGPPGRWLCAWDVPGSFAFKRIAAIRLDATGTEADLLPLRKFSRLEWLTVGGPITDAGLVHLEKLPALTDLDLRDTQVTDAGLVHLARLPALGGLYLRGTQVTDAGLVHLEKLPGLRDLDLRGTQVTDAGLVHLEKLPGLHVLHLAGTQVTDAGLAHLAKLSALTGLNLQGTQVTDAGLVHLEKLTTLIRLYLLGTPLTDAGLVHLAKLGALEYLDLRRTKVTPAGVARLRAALPGCTVVGPHPSPSSPPDPLPSTRPGP